MNSNLKWYSVINCIVLIPILADYAVRLSTKFSIPFPILLGCGLLVCFFIFLVAFDSCLSLKYVDENFIVFNFIKNVLNTEIATFFAAACLVSYIIANGLLSIYVSYCIKMFINYPKELTVLVAMVVLLISSLVTYFNLYFKHYFIITIISVLFLIVLLLLCFEIRNNTIDISLLGFNFENSFVVVKLLACLFTVIMAFNPINFRKWENKDKYGIYIIAIVMSVFFLAYFVLNDGYMKNSNNEIDSLMLNKELIFANSFFIENLMNFISLILMLICICTNMRVIVEITENLAKQKILPTLFKNNNDNIMFGVSLFFNFIFSSIGLLFTKGKMDVLINILPVSVFVYSIILYYSIFKKNRDIKVKFINMLICCIVSLILLLYLLVNIGYDVLLVLLTIFIFTLFMLNLKNYYVNVEKKLHLDKTSLVKKSGRSYSIIVISYFNKGVLPAVNYAKSISTDCRALYITDDYSNEETLFSDWEYYFPDVPFVTIKSKNNKNIIKPIMEYINYSKKSLGTGNITVVIPEYIPKHFSYMFLHRNYAFILKLLLARKKGIITTVVPYRSE